MKILVAVRTLLGTQLKYYGFPLLLETQNGDLLWLCGICVESVWNLGGIRVELGLNLCGLNVSRFSTEPRGSNFVRIGYTSFQNILVQICKEKYSEISLNTNYVALLLLLPNGGPPSRRIREK